jgi:hypothetical protein
MTEARLVTREQLFKALRSIKPSEQYDTDQAEADAIFAALPAAAPASDRFEQPDAAYLLNHGYEPAVDPVGNQYLAPTAAPAEGLLLAVEEVDNAWHDEDGEVRYSPELFERLVQLRAALARHESGSE